jgi:hypothetical protein
MNKAPGKKAASMKPKKNRVKRAPTKLWVTPVRMEMVPLNREERSEVPCQLIGTFTL